MAQDQTQQVQARGPDGSMHNFPAGTNPAIVDRVMKQYVQGLTSVPSEAQAAANPPTAPVNTNVIQPVAKTAGILSNRPGFAPGPDEPVIPQGSAAAQSGFPLMPGPGGQQLPPISENEANQRAKNALIIGGSMAAPEIAGPEAGLLLRSVLTGGGAGVGTAAGQAASGENPLTLPAAEESGRNALIFGGGDLALGAAAKGVGKTAAHFSPEGKVASFKKLSQQAIFPEAIKVNEQPELEDELNRVAKHVGQYTSPKGGTPLPEGGLFKNNYGALRPSADIVRQAGQNLWDENVQPVIENYAHVQRPTGDIHDAIMSTVSDTDRALDSPKVKATEKLANLYGEGTPKSVGDMAERVTELNNDKAVTRFHNMDANEQSQALLADPSLRGKVAELNALRGKMFETIGDEGGEAANAKFQEARKDWGALRNYEDRIRNINEPTPQPLIKKLSNTIRGAIGTHGSYGYVHPTPSDTLGNLYNPNRLIPKALNKLGQAGNVGGVTWPEQIDRVPFVPPPPNRMLPAAGGAGEGSVPPPGGIRGPVGGEERGLFERQPIQVGPGVQQGRVAPPIFEMPRSSSEQATEGTQRLASSPQGPQAITKRPGMAPTNILKSGRETAPIETRPTNAKGTAAASSPSPKTSEPMKLSQFSEKEIMQSAIGTQARKVLNDPAATARDKMVAQETLDHLKLLRSEGLPGSLSYEMDKNGTRWATRSGSQTKVSIPKGLSGSEADKYAKEKLDLQDQFMKGRQK